MAPQLYFAAVLSALHTGTVLAVSGLFAWLFRRGVARGRQVAGGRPPNSALSAKARREVALGQAIFFALVTFTVYPLWSMRGGRIDGAWHGPWWMLLHLLAFILIEDTIFYWAHRALHTRWLFRRIHAQHHRFRFVRTYTAEYAHPLENLMNFAAFFAGPVLLHTPFATLSVWIVVRMIETLEAHSGYALTTPSSRHSFHHLHATRGCYGSFVSPWDWLMGTDREWRKARAATRWDAAGSRR